MTADLRPIEARLLAAADAATWPPTPDLRGAVQSRIEAATPDLRGPVLDRITGTRPAPPPRLGRRPLVRGLALALVAVIAVAGVASALGYRLPGLDIVFVETLPPAGTALDLGSPVPIDEALAGERPRVLLPATLPRPSTAWVAGAADRTIVSLAWRAEPGQPTLDDSDLSLVLMAVPGTADERFLVKSLGPETTIETVSVTATAVGGSRAGRTRCCSCGPTGRPGSCRPASPATRSCSPATGRCTGSSRPSGATRRLRSPNRCPDIPPLHPPGTSGAASPQAGHPKPP